MVYVRVPLGSYLNEILYHTKPQTPNANIFFQFKLLRT